MPISAARISTEATAGAEVKLTASNFCSAMPVTSWSKSPSRGAGCQRYTRIGTTSAPAARSSSRNSGNGSQSSVAPCSCTAMRMAGDAALDAGSAAPRGTTRTPATTPRAGPRRAARRWPSARGKRCGPCRARRCSSLASPQPSAAATQPRKPMPVVAITMSGGASISASVCARNSSSSGSGTMVIAAARSRSRRGARSSALSSSARRAEVTATRNPVSGAQSGSLMSLCRQVVFPRRLPGHCPRTCRSCAAVLQ